MATVASTIVAARPARHGSLPAEWSLADLQEHLGGIPVERIRLFPPPGYAIEEDVLQAAQLEGRLCELEDGGKTGGCCSPSTPKDYNIGRQADGAKACTSSRTSAKK